MLKWVLAMVNYYGVAKGVEPKRKKVRRQAFVYIHASHLHCALVL